MKTIDYDRFYREFDLNFLTSPIGNFTKGEVATMLENLNLDGIDTNIDLFGIRSAFLRSLPQDLQDKCQQVNGKEAGEFIFRAEIISRIRKSQNK